MIVLVVLTLFLFAYGVNNFSQDRKVVKERISTMNSFLSSIEEDLPRQLYISGFRTIFLIEKEVIEKGTYVSDINSSFEESFYDGEVGGQFQEIMVGARFSDIQSSIQDKSSKLNINTTLSNPQVSIRQVDPWNVEVVLNVQLFMDDDNGLASWNKTSSYSALIPIENFEDPLYVINTNGRVPNKIQKSPYSFDGETNISDFNEHVLNSYYVASDSAPSFLDRLQGINSASSRGIESFVNLQELSSQGIATSFKSAVDYIYFSDNNPVACSTSGMPSWFRIDLEHLDNYGISCS